MFIFTNRSNNSKKYIAEKSISDSRVKSKIKASWYDTDEKKKEIFFMTLINEIGWKRRCSIWNYNQLEPESRL